MNPHSVCGRVLVGLALAAMPSAGLAVSISFEGLSDGTVVKNQFPGVTFSSVSGQEVRVTTQPGMGFGDNFICTAAIGGPINCLNPIRVDFSIPVDSLTFYAVGDNDLGAVAVVDVYQDFEFAGAIEIVGDGQPMLPNLVDLSGFQRVTSIRIHSVDDSAGLGYDLFSFQTVPEPAGLLLTSLAGAAFVAARFRSARR